MTKTLMLWAVVSKDGELYKRTLDDTMVQAEDTFRINAYPHKPMWYWEAKGYKAVRVTVTFEVEP